MKKANEALVRQKLGARGIPWEDVERKRKEYFTELTPEQRQFATELDNRLIEKYGLRFGYRDIYVYIIRCEKYVKIGISDNPIKRVSSLQGANPFPLKLIFYKRITQSGLAEKMLHTLYEDNNVMREWFELSDEQIEKAKELIEALEELK